jgi:hypothetical protein
MKAMKRRNKVFERLLAGKLEAKIVMLNTQG